MKIEADTPEAYVNQVPEHRREAIQKLREVIAGNLPTGFSETMNYGMIGYVVPKSVYPAGYHADPKQPLPFINIASQKNYIALYHMGLTADPELLDWFQKEYARESPTRLDMGKSCIRFKKPEQIPYEVLGKLASKMSAQQWITLYEDSFQK